MSGRTFRKSPFFDFLNRYSDFDYESFLTQWVEDIDYISWHGCCLPMAYGSAAVEYNAVRTSCALFDISPIKKYRIAGADAGLFLDTLLTRPMSTRKPNQVYYALLCNEGGMLLDAGLLYKIAAGNYLLMVSEFDHDLHFAGAARQFDNLQITEVTSSLCGLALQGPVSCAVLKSFGMAAIEKMKPYEIKTFGFGDGEVTVARTGFTADLGYEMWFKPELNKAVEWAISLAETTLNIKITGYGWNAVQALRLEGGFILPGRDTAQTFEDNEFERSPTELGLAWAVELDRKQDFIGKTALLKEKENGPRFELIGVTIDQEVELEDGTPVYAVIDGDRLQIGTLTSVAWSYGLHTWLGLASIKSDFVANDLKYFVKIRGRRITCVPAKLPFMQFTRHRRVPAPCDSIRA